MYAAIIFFGGQDWALAILEKQSLPTKASSGNTTHADVISDTAALDPALDDDTTSPWGPAPVANGEGKANATLVVLCRNSELEGVLRSMGHMERRFNKKYGYPWVFLNEERFTEEFKTYVFIVFLSLLMLQVKLSSHVHLIDQACCICYHCAHVVRVDSPGSLVSA